MVGRAAGAGLCLLEVLARPALLQPIDGKGNWTSKAPLPAARNEVAGVSFNGKLYVRGGSFAREKYERRI